MRRRTWALVRMADVIFSHQVSLPNMISESDCDAGLPSNIFDEEFGPDTKVLPPSRPQNEPTPISYMIAKVKLCLELGNILQATNRVGKQVPYDEILRFDQRLRDLENELPPHLRMQPLEGCHDPLTLIIARFNIDILYRKVMCLLHRKYLPRARNNPRYAHSRRSAIEASLETLHHLEVLHKESQPNGRLRSINWYVKSIATKDFLLPAMLILLDLHFDNEARRAGQRQDSQTLMFWTPAQRAEMIKVVETTRDMWSELQSTSMEATKASNIMTVMLDKINAPQTEPASASDSSAAEKANLFANMDPSDMQPEHSAAMTLGMLSGGMTPNAGGGFPAVQSPGGTNYPAMDLGLVPPVGERSGLTPDFSGSGGDMLGMANPGSPLSMFDSLGNNMDLSTNFDWVSITDYLSLHTICDYSRKDGWLTVIRCRMRLRTSRRRLIGDLISPSSSTRAPAISNRLLSNNRVAHHLVEDLSRQALRLPIPLDRPRDHLRGGILRHAVICLDYLDIMCYG
jgi:hypothetical protein